MKAESDPIICTTMPLFIGLTCDGISGLLLSGQTSSLRIVLALLFLLEKGTVKEWVGLVLG